MLIAKSLVIVTGAASGAGLATAKSLSAQGAQVALWDINAEKLQEALKQVDGLPIVVDITDEKAVEQAVKESMQGSSFPLRAVIQCAGIAPASRMTGKDGPKPLSHFDQVVRVNLIGTYNVMRVAAYHMSQQKPLESGERGVIINTASIAAFEGQVGQTAYSASKAGVVGLTLPAARELGSFGIRVMTIAPGLIDTPMLQGLPEAVRTNLESSTPFPKRYCKPEEFASLVNHILLNPMLNGEVIRLDGGLRMQTN